ncbi:hypothetical protein, variant 1, partial [Spizellomyces punctatus DAOM BR117]
MSLDFADVKETAFWTRLFCCSTLAWITHIGITPSMVKSQPTGGHVCPLCLYLMNSSKSLEMHLKESCGCPLSERTCKECDRVHKTRPEAIQCKHEGEISIIPCPVRTCSEEASTEIEFNSHYTKKHGRSPPIVGVVLSPLAKSPNIRSFLEFPPRRVRSSVGTGSPGAPKIIINLEGSIPPESSDADIRPFRFPQYRLLVIENRLLSAVFQCERDNPGLQKLVERIENDGQKNAVLQYAIREIIRRGLRRGTFLRDQDGYRLQFERGDWPSKDKYVYTVNGKPLAYGDRITVTLSMAPRSFAIPEPESVPVSLRQSSDHVLHGSASYPEDPYPSPATFSEESYVIHTANALKPPRVPLHFTPPGYSLANPTLATPVNRYNFTAFEGFREGPSRALYPTFSQEAYEIPQQHRSASSPRPKRKHITDDRASQKDRSTSKRRRSETVTRELTDEEQEQILRALKKVNPNMPMPQSITVETTIVEPRTLWSVLTTPLKRMFGGED